MKHTYFFYIYTDKLIIDMVFVHWGEWRYLVEEWWYAYMNKTWCCRELQSIIIAIVIVVNVVQVRGPMKSKNFCSLIYQHAELAIWQLLRIDSYDSWELQSR